MGWLFGKKKPKVPLPEGKPADAKTLQFPRPASSDKVIEPDEVKEAAGIPEPEEEVNEPMPEMPEPAPLPEMQEEIPPQTPGTNEPLFIKVDLYQRILGEIENLKDKLSELNRCSKILDSSEYNEEYHFDKLKKTIRSMHDRILDMDKKIFKIQGG